MRFLVSLATVFLIFTTPALADDATTTIPAGFAPTSIWLSTMSPTAGDKVTIYTVVYNSSTSSIEGSVGFYIDDTSIATVPFTLDAGQTSVESVAWTASAGTHALQAKVESAIDKSSKAPQALANLSTATTTVAVAENTGTTVASGSTGVASTVSAITNVASSLGNTINNSSPIVSSIASAIANQTEALRQAGITALSGQSASSSQASENASTTGSVDSTTTHGQVLGTSTYDAPVAEIHTPLKQTGILASISRFLLPIFVQPALFYPIFFLILVICLWLIAKRVLRPDKR